MHRSAVSLLILVAGLGVNCSAQPAAAPATKQATPAPEPAWVTRSNQYTQMLLDVQLKHAPEGGSAQGLAKYDPLITNATRVYLQRDSRRRTPSRRPPALPA